MNHPALPPNSPDPQLTLITIAELCRRLSKSKRTIHAWKKKGILPHVRICRSILFDWPAVKAHLAQHFGVNY